MKCTVIKPSTLWQDCDKKVLCDGLALHKENSYMICTTGEGLLHISDSGQIRGDMEEKIGLVLLNKSLVSELYNIDNMLSKQLKKIGIGEE